MFGGPSWRLRNANGCFPGTRVSRFLTAVALGTAVMLTGASVDPPWSLSAGFLALHPHTPDSLMEDLEPAGGRIRFQGQSDPNAHPAEVHGADIWHDNGYRGQGVKIGIIDMGFELYGPDENLPNDVNARCYWSDDDPPTDKMNDCNAYVSNWGTHGTKIVESVYKLAPEAEYYISNPPSIIQVPEVVDWMIGEGVDIINYSRSTVWDGPGDGSSPFTNSLLNVVDHAVANGILWVGSASNQAQHTWLGPFTDNNDDRYPEFAPNTEFIDITMDKNARYVTYLRWEDDWTQRKSNLDLFLQDPQGKKVKVARDALGPERPLTFLYHEASAAGTYRMSVLLRYLDDPPDWVQLMTVGAPQYYPYSIISGGSIRNPGESANPGMLTVGTANWDTPDVVATYSGRGPTPAGRTKPDIVATNKYYHHRDMKDFRGNQPRRRSSVGAGRPGPAILPGLGLRSLTGVTGFIPQRYRRPAWFGGPQ